MKGTDFIRSLPKNPSPARERAILQAIRIGEHAPITWQALPLRPYNGHTAMAFVMQDALKVGKEDSVRVTMTPPGTQRVADALDAMLPTTEIVDTAWQHSLTDGIAFDAILGPSDATMDDAALMIEHDREVERARAGRMGLVPNAGKHRVLTNKLLTSPGHSANYGFFASNAPHRTLSGYKAWQPLGLVHTYPPSLSDDDMAGHVDYSEKVWLMLKVMVVDYRLRAVADVASDPEIAPLISSEGILKLLRYPGVSVAGQIAPLPYPEDTSVSFSRELRLEKPFMRGADVAAWQKFLRVVPDGIFGPITKGATGEWQRLHMTGAELGLVDRRTVEAANEYLRTRIETGMAFVQARHFTKASRGRGDIYWIVLHTMEAAEKGTTAEACASYFHTVEKKVSAHYCLDNDSIVQCVRLHDVSYCAPGANKYGIHLEHAGYARQTASEWADPYSAAMLELSAGLTRKLRTAYDIPAQFVTVAMLREAKKRYDRGEAVPPELWGITTHHETTKAWGLSTHTDPGAHFPMQAYLDALR